MEVKPRIRGTLGSVDLVAAPRAIDDSGKWEPFVDLPGLSSCITSEAEFSSWQVCFDEIWNGLSSMGARLWAESPSGSAEEPAAEEIIDSVSGPRIGHCWVSAERHRVGWKVRLTFDRVPLPWVFETVGHWPAPGAALYSARQMVPRLFGARPETKSEFKDLNERICDADWATLALDSPLTHVGKNELFRVIEIRWEGVVLKGLLGENGPAFVPRMDSLVEYRRGFPVK